MTEVDFSLVSDDVFDMLDKQILGEDVEEKSVGGTPVCEDCDGTMDITQQGLTCRGCGLIRKVIVEELSELAKQNYNTNDNSAAAITVVGKDSYKYQKSLLCNISNYNKKQKKDTINQIKKCIFEFTGKTSVPNDVALAASELYYTIQQHHIYRGDVRRGIMGACIYHECAKRKIAKKKREIAELFKITQDMVSYGDNELKQLASEGIIHIEPDKDMTESFLLRYFESLNVPKKYKPFAEKFIEYCRINHIAVNSVSSTKCAGIIYLLAQRDPKMKVTDKEIQDQCGISKSTLLRFAKVINTIINLSAKDMALREQHTQYRAWFEKLFKIFNLPLKVEAEKK
nr:hypothetical protein K-LCC10_0039 [Kaumoebavirus]